MRSQSRRVRVLERARGIGAPPIEQIDFAQTLEFSPREMADLYRRVVREGVEVVGGPERIPFPELSTMTREEAARAYRVWSEEDRRTWPERLVAYKRSIGRSSA